MMSIYRYIVRNHIHISPSTFHNTATPGTPDVSSLLSFSPFKYPRCENKFLGFPSHNFGHKIVSYLDHGSWASEKLCAPNPPKIWSDSPASNLHSTGWTFLRDIRRQGGIYLPASYYMVRDLGLIFWDQQRLKSWRLLDFRSWVIMKTQLSTRCGWITNEKTFQASGRTTSPEGMKSY